MQIIRPFIDGARIQATHTGILNFQMHIVPHVLGMGYWATKASADIRWPIFRTRNQSLCHCFVDTLSFPVTGTSGHNCSNPHTSTVSFLGNQAHPAD